MNLIKLTRNLEKEPVYLNMCNADYFFKIKNETLNGTTRIFFSDESYLDVHESPEEIILKLKNPAGDERGL